MQNQMNNHYQSQQVVESGSVPQSEKLAKENHAQNQYHQQPQTLPSTIIVSTTPATLPKKDVLSAYILAFPLGLFGAHQFYLRRPGFGVLYMFTLGLFGVGFLVDLLRMPCLVKAANHQIQHPEEPQKKSLADAYVLWFPGGLFGLHHFYLGRIGWGILYLLTLGMLGVGWMIDGICMKYLVDDVNNKKKGSQAPTCPPHKEKPNEYAPHATDVVKGYVLGMTPISGLLGAHHYYYRRYGFGVLYTCTLGLAGVGYIVDWFRITCLAKRAQKKKMDGDDGLKYLDDAYLCLFPFGFLGLHHFYLRRYCWFVLYLCTVGCFGIGWLVDFVRLPSLVRDYNEKRRPCKVIVEQIVPQVPQGFDNSGMDGQGGVVVAAYPQGAAYPLRVCVPPNQGNLYYIPAGQNQMAHYAVAQSYPTGYMQQPLAPVHTDSGPSSWSTIESSEVGIVSPTYTGVGEDQQPPSYQDVMADDPSAAADNSLNDSKQEGSKIYKSNSS